MNENKVAIEGGLRAEIAEEFMGSIKKALEEHYIEVPDDKVDVLEELSDKVNSLEESLDAEVKKNLTLLEEIEEFTKDSIIEDVSDSLSLSESEKLRDLASNLKYVNEDDYRNKLNTLKESYFYDDGEMDSPITGDEEPLTEEVKTPTYADPAMAGYVRSLSRLSGSSKSVSKE